ncbi:MAG TPA: glycosyltransferase 87 family protein [Solirubrobacterales bacterium]|nr:glycosyltransferase 87 family protein [Solirubrobacterales bacterium]
MLIATVAVLAAALAAPAPAVANEDFAREPPFGGELPPTLVRPESERLPPAGFELSALEAIEVADGAEAVREERDESAEMRAIPFQRGGDWQVSYFTGSGPARSEVAQAIVDDQTGRVLGAWHDQQLGAPLARGYSGAIAQKVNAPYVWLPLCLLFLVPFIDPRRPFRLLHLDLLVLLGLGVSLLFFNRGEVTASVPLTYPVLGYVLARMLWVGVRPRERPGPLIPVLPVSWLAIGAVVLVCARIALNVADSRVIDIGVAGVVGADHLSNGREIYNGDFAPGVGIRGDVYGPLNYIAYVPFEAVFPWQGEWGEVPAAHAAAIAFDLLTALGLLALGRRLRPGGQGRTLGIALAFAWLAYPFTLYTMNANANDSLIAAIGVGAMLVLASPPARGAVVALASGAKFGPAALAPLFATGTGERRWRSAVVFGIAFCAVSALLVLPFLPDGGPRELYDRTLGYQASRSSPFSVWGLSPSLDFLRPLARAGAIALALAVALWPRRKTPAQVAALAAAVLIAVQLGATHWFYFYVVWFLPLVLLALFVAQRGEGLSRSSSEAAPGSAS